MNKTRQAVIKRIGNGVVDVQPVGSANVIKNVKVSGQISWDLLTPGTNVVLDELSQLPIVTHTIAVGPQYYGSHGQSYTNVINNALLADGSVALVGNLPVAPGVTVDGYDISLLGQAIVNLQAADTIARTGYTVLSHATHLVATIDADATTIMVRDALFDDGEEIALSNTEGHVEYMIINGAPVLTVDNQGAPAWNYTVFRRSYTDPPNIEIGWAAATLINGLTTKGFIYMDGRGGSDKAPSINVTVIPNPVTHTKNQVVAIGNLSGLLDFEDDSYGLAVGRLSTADIYFSFNNRTAELKLANADITGSSGTGSESEEYYRIFGLFEDDHMPGDVRFGGDGGRLELWNETHKLAMLNGDAEIFTIDPSGARFMNMVWAGSVPGPQVGIGQDGSNAVIALRGEIGSAGFVATGSADGRVYVYTGNPPPLPNHWYYDSLTNKAGFDGDFTVRNMRVEGQIQFSSVGSVKVLNPSDPLRYGMIVPHGQYGYSVDAGNQQHISSVLAWAPLTLDTEPGLAGYTHTYLAGEVQFGRRRYRHFRIEPGAAGRVGLFNGDTPLVWLDYAGDAYMTGNATITGGAVVGDLVVDPGSIVAGQGNVTIDDDGVTLSATVGKFSSASLDWATAGTVNFSVGTIVDLGTATGAYVEAVSIPLQLKGEGVAIDPGGGDAVVSADTLIIDTSKTPASAGAAGTLGSIAWDASYIYVAVGSNTWKRAALSTW